MACSLWYVQFRLPQICFETFKDAFIIVLYTTTQNLSLTLQQFQRPKELEAERAYY